MSILEDECPNYCIGNNTTDRLNSIPSSENTNVWALRSNSQANIKQNAFMKRIQITETLCCSYQIKYCIFVPKSRHVKIFCTVNCKSANVIYILECSVCGLQCVDQSKQPFHKRLNGHMSDLIKKTFVPVSQHSRLSDHSLEDFNRMRILIIEQNCLWSDFQRENWEIYRIKQLRVLHPDGINRKQQIFMYIFFHSVYS